MEMQGFGVFLSAVLWKAGVWHGPKVTVVETRSNVSPSARGQKQGHSTSIHILKEWTSFTTNKLLRPANCKNINKQLFLVCSEIIFNCLVLYWKLKSVKSLLFLVSNAAPTDTISAWQLQKFKRKAWLFFKDQKCIDLKKHLHYMCPTLTVYIWCSLFNWFIKFTPLSIVHNESSQYILTSEINDQFKRSLIVRQEHDGKKNCKGRGTQGKGNTQQLKDKKKRQRVILVLTVHGYEDMSPREVRAVWEKEKTFLWVLQEPKLQQRFWRGGRPECQC